MNLTPIDFNNPTHCEAMAGLWTGACGPALALSPRFVQYSTRPIKNIVQNGWFAWREGEPLGFVIASKLDVMTSDNDEAGPSDRGWISAIATLPETQRQGIGTTLLAWAEGWLADLGCHQIMLGANFRPFVPGLPMELGTESFFLRHGYAQADMVWDMAANLAKYSPPSILREVEGAVRPAQPGQEQALLAFLSQEFPGRWHNEFDQFVAEGGRISDYMLLWTERGITGFCRVTFEDSQRTVERFYPYQLPRPWGQLGPIGISQAERGMGFGASLLDAGLRRLHNNGINGCVIDWTTQVDFYAKFGFKQYRSYLQMVKSLKKPHSHS
ncbi:MAG: GNAT family N-acetyltransferase [Chloroflexota bacterium]